MASLLDLLTAAPLEDGVPLPSIRSLARHYGVAPLTVHRALRTLLSRGLVHVLDRKGYFWGALPRPVEPLRRSPQSSRTIRERLVSDLRCAVFHPHRDLPPRAVLAQIYGVSVARLGAVLSGLADDGLLVRRGRAFALPPPPRPREHGTVLVVTRCNAEGTLLLETERQTDFVKSVHREGRDLGLRVVVAGWHDGVGQGVLLDQDGRPFDARRLPGALLGVLGSTWLVRDPAMLLGWVSPLRVPVSLWWEHPPDAYASAVGSMPSTVGFDISFGTSSGIAVGRFLKARGEGPIFFLSPFHASAWSRARLEGLEEGLAGSGLAVGRSCDDAFANAWELQVREGGAVEGESRLRGIVAELLERASWGANAVLVAVNDHVAMIAISLLRERGIPRPRLVSFDNSTGADAHQFDSFEFHTEGMVRQMLYHVLHPTARLYRGGGLHEMVGRLVQRT